MNPSGSVVTVGTFDGVHLGHRAVLNEVERQSLRREGRRRILFTFEPHPLDVVNPSAAPPRLTTARERLEVLACSTLDEVRVLHFDRVMAAMPPEVFVEEVLLQRCGMRDLVVGHDHGFGKGRQGDAEMLQQLGSRHGFTVTVVQPVTLDDGHVVSSTLIRRAVAGGDLATAARHLGRWYTVSSRVEHGAKRGRTIGFPTLNLKIPRRKLLPPDGVYAVRVESSRGSFLGMMNQGHRPTFEDGRRLMEVHLFDFEGDLYQQEVRVTWLTLLREIRRFDGEVALRRQLEEDRHHARAALAAVHSDPEAE